MTDEEMRELVKLRLESSRELYNDACNLYEQGSYKSANNRAYYSMEKALKALLAIKGKDANTHNGILQLFNRYFIYEDNTEFNYIEENFINKQIGENKKVHNLPDFERENK